MYHDMRPRVIDPRKIPLYTGLWSVKRCLHIQYLTHSVHHCLSVLIQLFREAICPKISLFSLIIATKTVALMILFTRSTKTPHFTGPDINPRRDGHGVMLTRARSRIVVISALIIWQSELINWNQISWNRTKVKSGILVLKMIVVRHMSQFQLGQID